MDSNKAIVDALRSAFPARRERPFAPLVNSVQGDEPLRVEADFQDKDDWTALSPRWLNMVADDAALNFLSDEAVRFYIPAYLVADLTEGLQRVDPTFILVHGFDDLSFGQRIWPRKEATWTDYAKARWDGLTPAQARAVAHYLEWRVRREGVAGAGSIVEALKTYWYARAAG